MVDEAGYEDQESSKWLATKFGDAAVDRVDESAPPFGRSKSSTKSRMVRCEKHNDESDKRDKRYIYAELVSNELDEQYNGAVFKIKF